MATQQADITDAGRMKTAAALTRLDVPFWQLFVFHFFNWWAMLLAGGAVGACLSIVGLAVVLLLAVIGAGIGS